MSDSTTKAAEEAAIQGISVEQSRAAIEEALAESKQHLAELPATADAVDRARIQLDIAEALLGLERKQEAAREARQAFDALANRECWQEAVEACELLYEAGQEESIVALGHGIWLAVTYPIKAQTTVAMLSHVIDETPPESDGAAVAAVAAQYIAELRGGDEKDSLKFLTSQLIAQVAKRHRGIEGQEMLDTWIEMLELNDVGKLLGRLGQIVDAIVADQWWIDRDALRARLPVN
jgi:hypothetical protein